MPLPASIPSLLSDEVARRLQAGYDDLEYGQIGGSTLAAYYPAMKPYMDGAVATLYGPLAAVRPKLRQSALLALLCGKGDVGKNLALHVYVSIGVGLTPADIAGVLTTAGVYGSMDFMSLALTTTATTLTALESANAKTSGPIPLATAIEQVLAAMAPKA